jgi:hypothetical protein
LPVPPRDAGLSAGGAGLAGHVLGRQPRCALLGNACEAYRSPRFRCGMIPTTRCSICERKRERPPTRLADLEDEGLGGESSSYGVGTNTCIKLAGRLTLLVHSTYLMQQSQSAHDYEYAASIFPNHRHRAQHSGCGIGDLGLRALYRGRLRCTIDRPPALSAARPPERHAYDVGRRIWMLKDRPGSSEIAFAASWDFLHFTADKGWDSWVDGRHLAGPACAMSSRGDCCLPPHLQEEVLWVHAPIGQIAVTQSRVKVASNPPADSVLRRNKGPGHCRPPCAQVTVITAFSHFPPARTVSQQGKRALR